MLKDQTMLKQTYLAGKKNCKKNNKMSGVLFKENSNGKIRYNYLQLSEIYRALKSLWKKRLKK